MEFKFTITTKHDMKEKCCKRSHSQKTCDDVVACSDNIVAKLEQAGVKLKKNSPTDIVNGHVNISHGEEQHVITVGIIEGDEPDLDKYYVKPTKMPTREQLERLL